MLFVFFNFKNDREIVLRAVSQNCRALLYASPELQNDREIILSALTFNCQHSDYITIVYYSKYVYNLAKKCMSIRQLLNVVQINLLDSNLREVLYGRYILTLQLPDQVIDHLLWLLV